MAPAILAVLACLQPACVTPLSAVCPPAAPAAAPLCTAPYSHSPPRHAPAALRPTPSLPACSDHRILFPRKYYSIQQAIISYYNTTSLLNPIGIYLYYTVILAYEFI